MTWAPDLMFRELWKGPMGPRLFFKGNLGWWNCIILARSSQFYIVLFRSWDRWNFDVIYRCTPRCTQSHAVHSFVRISQVAVVLPDRSAAVARSKLLDCFLGKCPVAQVEAPFLLRFFIQQELGIHCEWSPKIACITYLKSAKTNTDFSLMHHGLMDCILST